jgi:hypothetical protein
MSDSIVGTWYVAPTSGGSDQVAITFFANGTFLVADKGTHANDPTGESGLEWGTYTWNAVTGAVSFNVQINTDGEWGLSHSHITTMTVTDQNILTFTGSEGSLPVNRLISPPNSIIGSWGFGNSVVFTFLANGTYLLADKGADPNDTSGHPGIEWGTYTWDPATGALHTTTIVNDDGQWGFARTAGEAIAFGATVSGDSLIITAPDGDGGTLARISPVSVLNGTAGADVLFGAEADETFTALGGNDTVEGFGGIDTLSYAGNRANYSIDSAGTEFVVHDNVAGDGTDTLIAMERLHFADVNVALDLDGNAGLTAKLLGAVFGPDAVQEHPDYMGIGIYLLDIGLTYDTLLQKALSVALGSDAANPTAVVTLLYTNVMGVAPPPDDLAFFVGLLNTHALSIPGLGVLAANTTFNQANIDLAGLAETGVEYIPFG